MRACYASARQRDRGARACAAPPARSVVRALLLTLTLPRIHESMTAARVDAVHLAAGAPVAPGARIVDLTVDLSAAAEQDCPPIAHYRIVLLERGWLREVAVAPGDEIAVGAQIATIATTADEPLDAAPARAARTSIAGILKVAPGGGAR